MDINDLHKGVVIMVDGTPFRVIEHQAVKPGKGTAFARTKLRSLMDDKVVEYTFKAGENIEGANVSNRDSQYLYNEKGQYHFMLVDTYEQYALGEDVIGERTKFFKENMEARLVFLDETPIDVVIPHKMDFKVTSSPPDVKGNTATGVSKQVTIETGAQINVPLFVKEGDTIRVNTETGEYDSRV